MKTAEKTLLLGLGHPYRSDDAFGPHMIAALRNKFADAYDFCVHSGDPLDLIETWAGRQLIIFDALQAEGKPPGTLTCIRWRDGEPLLPSRATSSHALSLAEAMALGRVLEKLPADLLIVGVAATNFQPGAELSPAVAAAMDQVLSVWPQLPEGG